MKTILQKLLKSPWFYVCLICAIALLWQQWRISSIESRWQKSIEQAVEQKVKKIDEERKDFEKLYKLDKKLILNELEQLRKAKKQVDTKIAQTEGQLNEMRQKSLTPADIDKRLNELFGKPGMGKSGR